LQNILAKLKKESHPFSLQKECLHIIKTFKFFCQSTFGRLHIPLAHPNKGLSPCMILHYYRKVKAQCTANHCCPRCVGLWGLFRCHEIGAY
jgi:hypothetical protein